MPSFPCFLSYRRFLALTALLTVGIVAPRAGGQAPEPDTGRWWWRDLWLVRPGNGAAAPSPGALGEDLVVDSSNSPYAFSSGAVSYDNIFVGQSGAGVLNQSGGTLTASSGGQLLLGYNTGSSGAYNLSGGTLNTVSTDVGDFGTAVFTLSGAAAHNVTGAAGTANGSLDIGYYSGSNGTYNLNGGTLTAGYVRGGSGTSTFNFNGGTLAAGASATDFFQSLSAANVQAGGARINTGVYNVTIAQALAHDPALGSTADGGLTKTGAGALTLSGTNTYTGGTTISAGRLIALNNGNALSAGQVNIASGAILELNTSAGSTITQAGTSTFTGSGLLLKTGAGTLQFGGNGGNVNVALGAGGYIDVQGGTLIGSSFGNGVYTNNLAGLNIASGATLNGVEALVRIDGLSGAGTLKGGYGGTVNTTIGVNNGGGIFSGSIQDYDDNGSRLALVKTGTGTQILSGTNTYTGGTTISGGTLQIGDGGMSGTLGSGDVSNAGTLTFNRSNDLTVANTITRPGSSLSSITQSGAGILTLSGTFTARTLNINAGTLKVTGSGTATSSASVNAGRLEIASGGFLGTPSVTVASGASLDVTGGSLGVSVTTVQISGGGLLSSGTINVQNFFVMNAGSYSQIGGALTAGQFLVGSSGSNTATYDLDGGTLTTTSDCTIGGSGSGVLNVNNATHAASGGVVLGSQGTYNLGGGGRLQASGIFGNGDGGTINFNGGSLSPLTAGGAFTMNGLGAANVGAGGVTFDAGSSSSTSSFSTIGVALRHDPTSGAAAIDGGMTKLGSNTLYLYDNKGNPIDYTGPTVISAGTLNLGYSDARIPVQFGPSNIVNNGALAISAANNFTIAGNISGSGSVTQASLYQDVLGTVTLTGNNTYTGGTTLTAGTLILGSANAIGSTGTITFNGGFLGFSAVNTNDYSARFSTMDGQKYGFNTNGQNVTLSAALPSVGSALRKIGDGTMILSVAQPAITRTTVGGGALQLGVGGALPNGPVVLLSTNGLAFSAGASPFSIGGLLGTGNQTLNDTAGAGINLSVNTNGDSSQYGTLPYYGVLSGAGSLTVTGSNTLILAGNNTYTGGTTINAGSTLQLGAGEPSGSIRGNVVNNGTLNFARCAVNQIVVFGPHGGDNYVFAGVISGSGSVGQAQTTSARVIYGADGNVTSIYNSQITGDITLTGNNTYTGTTTIPNSNRWRIGDGGTSGTLGSGQVNMILSAHLIFNRAGAVTQSGNITGEGDLTQAGSGALILTGNNTYSRGTTANAGTLLVNNTSGSGVGSGAVTVNNSGTLLGGNGRIGGDTTINASAKISPGATGGNSIATLSFANTLAIAGAYQVDLNPAAGTTQAAGVNFDQVTTVGALTLDSVTSTLSIGGVNRTNLALGQVFFIALNGGSDATGTFHGLLEGAAIIDAAGDSFRISYAATGDSTAGNDISLTVSGMAAVPEPATWLAGALLVIAAGVTLHRCRCSCGV